MYFFVPSPSQASYSPFGSRTRADTYDKECLYTPVSRMEVPILSP